MLKANKLSDIATPLSASTWLFRLLNIAKSSSLNAILMYLRLFTTHRFQDDFVKIFRVRPAQDFRIAL